MSSNGGHVQDPDRCAKLRFEYFQNKFSSVVTGERQQLVDFAFQHDGCTMDLSLHEVSAAFNRLREKTVMDCYGISIAALELHFARPSDFRACITVIKIMNCLVQSFHLLGNSFA